jgi:hypothetical protein
MNDKEKLLVIQSVLIDAAGPLWRQDGADIDNVIETIRDLTGDQTFCTGNVRSLDDIKNTFEIHIETWENDADDYRTIVHTGLTLEDVHFYHDLAKRFKSRNSRPVGGLGNDDHELDFLVELVNEVVASHPDMSAETASIWCAEVDEDNNYARLCDYVLHDPVEYDYGFCRVFDKFKVFAVKDGKRVDVTVGF